MIRYMIVVLSGPNDYQRHAELARRVSEFSEKFGDINIERIDAADIELGSLLERVMSMPFLAERRLIVITNIAANKSLTSEIEQFLDSVSDTTDVIIDEQKFDKRLLLYRTLKKRTEFIEFGELDERKLASWLSSEASDRGGELKTNDALYLVMRAGLNQQSLSNELDKLLLCGKTITKSTIDKLVEPLPTGTMFDLLDATFAGNHARALSLYSDQRKQQVEPQAVMGMIAWQIHTLAVVKVLEKEPVDSIASRAKLNPYVVRKTLQLVKNLTLSDVKQTVARAVHLDARLKSEMIDADDAVQQFLLTI